jgi:hypothetical protein
MRVRDRDADGTVIPLHIHGCNWQSREIGGNRQGTSENVERKATDDSTEVKGTTDDERMPGTALKHFVTHRVRLPKQTEYIDSKPCIVFIPVMTVKCWSGVMKCWSGGEYSAISQAGRYLYQILQLISRMRRQRGTVCILNRDCVPCWKRPFLDWPSHIYFVKWKRWQQQLVILITTDAHFGLRVLSERHVNFLRRTPDALTGEGVIVPRSRFVGRFARWIGSFF